MRAPPHGLNCFFVGLTQEQAAKELGVYVSTVARNRAYVRAWMLREIQTSKLRRNTEPAGCICHESKSCPTTIHSLWMALPRNAQGIAVDGLMR
jgi:hypothetical protein